MDTSSVRLVLQAAFLAKLKAVNVVPFLAMMVAVTIAWAGVSVHRVIPLRRQWKLGARIIQADVFIRREFASHLVVPYVVDATCVVLLVVTKSLAAVAEFLLNTLVRYDMHGAILVASPCTGLYRYGSKHSKLSRPAKTTRPHVVTVQQV